MQQLEIDDLNGDAEARSLRLRFSHIMNLTMRVQEFMYRVLEEDVARAKNIKPKVKKILRRLEKKFNNVLLDMDAQYYYEHEFV